jgi:Protoheme ferro-lyase (ferrochelatase)
MEPPLDSQLGTRYSLHVDLCTTFSVKWRPFRVLGSYAQMRSNRLGVVLFQLGGPETLEAIEPFLFNLFCDPDIIDFPFAKIGRKPLAKLISTTRAKKVQHHYAVIGGGSPIRSSPSSRRSRCGVNWAREV